ncbi:LolA family protein [Natronospira proteinivora]|uniref:LolA family protein n=1 Tax=Natronospira proteinivora TaxID=1807133 RepID=UPI00209F076B
MLFVLLMGLVTPLAAEPAAFEARFQQERTTPGLDRAFRSEGRVHWVAGEELRWETESPFEHVYRLLPDRIIEIHPEGEAEEIRAEDAPWVVSLNELLMALMSGDQEQLAALFDVQPLAADDEDGMRFRLKPRDEALAEQIDAIEVVQGRWPEHIHIKEADGGHLDIRLSDHQGDRPDDEMLEVEDDS